MGEREGGDSRTEWWDEPTNKLRYNPVALPFTLRFPYSFYVHSAWTLVFPTSGRTQGRRFTGSPPLHTTYYRHLLHPECCGQCSTFGAVSPPARSLANGPPRFLGKGRSIETQRSDSLVRFPYERTSRAPNTRCPRERESLYFVSSGTTRNH
jgi:hypothetical protein